MKARNWHKHTDINYGASSWGPPLASGRLLFWSGVLRCRMTCCTLWTCFMFLWWLLRTCLWWLSYFGWLLASILYNVSFGFVCCVLIVRGRKWFFLHKKKIKGVTLKSSLVITLGDIGCPCVLALVTLLGHFSNGATSVMSPPLLCRLYKEV